MSRFAYFLLVLVLMFVGTFTPAVHAQDMDACSGVLLFEGRARSSVTDTAAAYGVLANLGDEPVTLTGGSTDAAEVVEIHTMTIGADDVMRMEPLPDGLTIPPHSFVTLEPGGLHVMLINLTDALEAGNILDLTLEFDGAESVPAQFPIVDIESGMDMGDMSTDGMSEDSDMGMDNMGGMPGMGGMVMGCEGVYVLDPWVRPSVTSTGAAYGLIINLTDADITLTGGSTDAAEVVEIHTMSVGDDDVMRMEPLPDGLTLQPGQHATLQPGGLHMMMINLSDMLMAGESIDLTFDFDGADAITLTVPIEDRDTTLDMMHDPMEGGEMDMSNDG